MGVGAGRNKGEGRAENKGEEEAAHSRRLRERSHIALCTPLALLGTSMAPQCHLNKNNALAGHLPLSVPHHQPN